MHGPAALKPLSVLSVTMFLHRLCAASWAVLTWHVGVDLSTSESNRS